jgi:hypothetical protein
MKNFLNSFLFILIFLFFTGLNSSFAQASNSSVKSNNIIFDFITANKHIDFEKVWSFKKSGIYDGAIIKTNYVSSPSFNLSKFSEDYDMFSNQNYIIYQDCSDIYAYNKSTKKYFQIWYVNVYALRNCPYSTEFITDNSIVVNFHNPKVNIEINLLTMKYRVLVN